MLDNTNFWVIWFIFVDILLFSLLIGAIVSVSRVYGIDGMIGAGILLLVLSPFFVCIFTSLTKLYMYEDENRNNKK